MTTEQHFATAYDAVADMMDAAKPSPQKAAIEHLLDTSQVFIAELKNRQLDTERSRSAKAEGTREYHTHNTHNGHRYDVKAEQSVANQQNVYQQAYTTHQYVYHEPAGPQREPWVLPGGLTLDMASVEMYDSTTSTLHLRSGKTIGIKPNQVNRLLSWYYMKGLLTPPKQRSEAEVRSLSGAEERSLSGAKVPNDPAKSAAIIAAIKRQLDQNAKNKY